MDTNNSDSNINSTGDPAIHNTYLKYEAEWRSAYIMSMQASMYGTHDDKRRADIIYKNAINNLDNITNVTKK